MNRKKKGGLPAKSFKSNKRGAIWIWAVCLLSIIVYAITWFSLGWAFDLFVTSIQAAYTFPSQATVTISFICTVVYLHPIFFILGMLLWAFVNSQRREEVTYPYPY